MTGLIVLDVFISLVFVFLLYSLFTMTLIESMTSIFSSRAKNLLAGIERLLADEEEANTTNHTIVNLFWASTNSVLTKAFYKHPSIKYLGPKGVNSKPSYISSNRFSETLVDLLKKGTNSDTIENISAALGVVPKFHLQEIESEIKGLEEELNELSKDLSKNKYRIESTKEEISLLQRELENRSNSVSPFLSQNFKLGTDTKYQLNLLWTEAGDDVEKFKALLERWYDDQMDRITGWYKRKLSLLTFILGLIIAISFQVDTISLAINLSKNEDLRTVYVEGANEFIENNETLADLTEESKRAYFDTMQNFIAKNNIVFTTGEIDKADNMFITFLGYLITAFAISLGAPFWFDMLSKLMRVRTSLQPAPSPPVSGNSSSDKNITKAVG